MEFKEIETSVKKVFGENGMFLVVGGFLFVFVIVYMMQSKKDTEETETVKITGAYSSYPDTVTNANTIIDTMQESTDFQTEELKNYIDDVLEQESEEMKDLLSEYNGSYPDNSEDLESLSSNVNSLYSKVNTLESNTKNIKSSIKSLIETVNNANKTTVSSNKGSISNPTNEYFKKTTYNGVSIVDGLKAIGEYKNSSYSARKQIAKANGIANYTGTAKQNTELLNKLKNGTLLKP